MTIKFEYKYDAWNRLVQVLLPVVSSTNPYVQYEYDGLNRLIVRQADPGADGTIDETRQFYYTQEWQVIEEQVGATASTARPDVQYVWGTQYVDDLVVRYRDADASGSSGSPSLEEELYSLADANFNVTAVTENDGDVVERFTYTPYGVSTALDPDFTSYTGADYNWKYRYTTRELDPLTGKQLNRERWYDALLGRWQSRDPIGYEGSQWNLYEYVESRPTIWLDPSGKGWFGDIWDWCFGNPPPPPPPPCVPMPGNKRTKVPSPPAIGWNPTNIGNCYGGCSTCNGKGGTNALRCQECCQHCYAVDRASCALFPLHKRCLNNAPVFRLNACQKSCL